MTVEHLILAVFVYYIGLHGTYLLLIVIGALELRKYHLEINFGEFQRIADSPLTTPFTVIIPAYNEEALILSTVMSALNSYFPQHEVIVVNDGSSDRTLQILIDHFGLVRVQRARPRNFETKPIRGIYQSPDYPKLVVVDKENGKRGDACNAGANLARYPILCIIDADCVLEEDALLRVVRPFLHSSKVIAASGIVLPANGLDVRDGHIWSPDLPQRWLPLFQMAEYVRSFQWARIGLAKFRSMLCISGAFLLVRKEIYVELGGLDPDSITDDIDFTMKLNRYVYERGQGERMEITYVPDPVCYTEVPESMRIHAAQRNRWQRGTLRAVLLNLKMLFNPRYRATGMFGMPFFLFFEALSAPVEAFSYALMPVLLYYGLANWSDMLLFFMLAVMLGSFLAVMGVLLQETTRLRPARTRDLARLLWAGFLENFGYHQMHLLWRLGGTFDYLIRGRTDTGKMERYGSYQKAG
jgi:cellulose synthase/poly-beta-1,6-N-acetylglucosamine synthase-like glycosyltransferase